jgi:hypothetical protein
MGLVLVARFCAVTVPCESSAGASPGHAVETAASSTAPPFDALPKNLFRRVGHPLNCQWDFHPFRLSGRSDCVQPAPKTFRNEGGSLGQFQGTLEAIEAR